MNDPTPVVNRDRALRTARDMVAAICVCGDLDTEHESIGGARYGRCCERGCECQRFRRATQLRVGWIGPKERA